MTTKTIQAAQDLATSLGLSSDSGLFMQALPAPFLAALARGSIDLLALAQEELANRGLDRQAKWVGFEAAQALLVPKGNITLDMFADDEHARIVAFRNRWHEANKINPEFYPLAMAEGNDGIWTEELISFDPEDPFDMPEPPKEPAAKSRKRQP